MSFDTFSVVALIMAIITFVSTPYRAWRLLLFRQRAITAEGVCLRAWQSWSLGSGSGRASLDTHAGFGGGGSGIHFSQTEHRLYEFVPRWSTTPVQFEESPGRVSAVPGSRITVYYLPQDPHSATTIPPSTARLVMTVVSGVVTLVALAAFVAFDQHLKAHMGL